MGQGEARAYASAHLRSTGGASSKHRNPSPATAAGPTRCRGAAPVAERRPDSTHTGRSRPKCGPRGQTVAKIADLGQRLLVKVDQDRPMLDHFDQHRRNLGFHQLTPSLVKQMATHNILGMTHPPDPESGTTKNLNEVSSPTDSLDYSRSKDEPHLPNSCRSTDIKREAGTINSQRLA